MRLVVSLHDVHPSSLDAVARQRKELRQLGVRRVSLLVVPNWHRAEPVEGDLRFVDTITRWQEEGDEIVLHGWVHSTIGMRESTRHLFWTRFYTARESEFLLAGEEECRARLVTGRSLFERFGWNVVGFIAPAWLMAPHVPGLLQSLGFAYTTTRTEVVPLGLGAPSVRSTSLCYSTRTLWRRLASLGWNPWVARKAEGTKLMRVSLHPGDLHHRAVWRQVRRLVSRSLQHGRSPMTYRDFIISAGHVRPPVRSSTPTARF